MKQTKFNDDAHVFNDMKGRMTSEYKAEVSKYKADVAAGRIKPVVVEAKEPKEDNKEQMRTKYNKLMETEQTRFEVK